MSKDPNYFILFLIIVIIGIYSLYEKCNTKNKELITIIEQQDEVIFHQNSAIKKQGELIMFYNIFFEQKTNNNYPLFKHDFKAIPKEAQLQNRI